MSTSSDSVQVECPSGLTGFVRALTVGDLNAMAQRSLRKKGGDQTGRLLSSIWEQTTRAGIYKGSTFVEEGKPIINWEELLVGDRAFLVIQARRLTFGDDFFFSFNCRGCETRVDWKIDLNELKVSKLSQEAIDNVTDTGLEAVFYRTLPKSGKKVGFKLLTGKDQLRITQSMAKGEDEANITALLSRIPFIEGVTSPVDRKQFIERMHLLDAEFLKEQWSTTDITVQDTLEVECTRCFRTEEKALPIDERFFSVRSTRKTQEKM